MAQRESETRAPIEAASSGKDVFTTLGEVAGAKVREAVDLSRGHLEELKKKSLEEIMQDGREWIRKNPGKSVLGGLALGFLLGRLFRRR